MKYSMALVAAGAALAAAQLPSCAQTCVNNMNALAESLGCPGAQASCLCSKVDYGYGIRDCSNAVCAGNAAYVQSAVSYGVSYCESALSGSASATGAGAIAGLTGTGSSGGSASATTTGTGASSSGTGAAGGAGASSTGSGAGSAITTAPITTEVTESGTSFVSTIGETTIYSSGAGGVGGVGGVGGSGSSTTAASGAESSSGAGGASSSSGAGAGGASSTTSHASSSSGAGGAAASTTTSGGAAAMMTAGPLLGMAALAVLAL